MKALRLQYVAGTVNESRLWDEEGNYPEDQSEDAGAERAEQFNLSRTLLEELASAVDVVANSISFALPSLPAKQRPALQAIEDELRVATARARSAG